MTTWFQIKTMRLDESGLKIRVVSKAKGLRDAFLVLSTAGHSPLRREGKCHTEKGQEEFEFIIDKGSLLESDAGSCIALGFEGLAIEKQFFFLRKETAYESTLMASDIPSEVFQAFVDSMRMFGDKACIPAVAEDGSMVLVVGQPSHMGSVKLRSAEKLPVSLKSKLVVASLINSPSAVKWILGQSPQKLMSCIQVTSEGAVFSGVPDQEAFPLAMNPLDCLMEEGKLSISTASWVDGALLLTVEHPKLPAWVANEVNWSLIAKTGDDEALCASCLSIAGKTNNEWYSSVDVASLCRCVKPGDVVELTWYLVGAWRDYAYKSGPLRLAQMPEVTDGLLGGWHMESDVFAIPVDLGADGIRLLVADPDADVSKKVCRECRDALLRAPVFENRVLFAAMMSGRGETARLFAAALADGTLQTVVHVGSGHAVTCDCVAEGKTIEVSLDGMDGAKEATLLDEGCTFAQLTANKDHEIQFQALYDMLVEIDELCQENGIEYYLAAGTLLGAVRHHGFIPWDHDMDLFMRDTEFEKLRRVFEEGRAPKGRILDTCLDDPLYPERLGRYVNCETTRFNPAKPRGLGGIGGAGMFVDIFTLAPVAGDSFDEREDHMSDFLLFEEIRNRFDRKHSVRPKRFCDKLKNVLDIWDSEGYEAALDSCRDGLQRYRADGSDYLATQSGGTFNPYGRYAHASFYGTPKRVNLMGHDFNIPEDSYGLLQDIYGFDWRVYPSKRHVPEDPGIYNSVKVPYALIVEEGLAAVSREDVLEVRTAQKRNQLKDLVLRSPIDEARRTLMQYEFKRIMDKRLKTASAPLADLVKRGAWGELDKLFRDYYSHQSLGAYGRLRRYAPLSPEAFNAALFNLICNRDNVKLACKIIKIREAEGGPLDPVEQEAAQVVFDVCALRDAVEQGDLEGARQLIERLEASSPSIPFVVRVKAMLNLASATDEQTATLLGQAKARYLSRGSQYDLFIMAECHRRLGNTGIAQALYCRVRQKCLDGVVLNVVADRLGG